MAVQIVQVEASSRKVECTIQDVELVGDHTPFVDGVEICCGRCDHKVEAFGTSEKSARYALSQLRKGCPLKQHNFYFYPGLE